MYTHWKNISYVGALATMVPSEPGVYAITKVKRALGLLIEVRVIYVGKSRDLRRRFKEHVRPWRSHNPNLARLPIEPATEFWFRPVRLDQLDEVERALIRQAQPEANRIHYTSEQ